MTVAKPPSLTLIIPGLTGFSATQWQEVKSHLPALPSLSRLLCRSRRISHSTSGYEAILARKFGLPPNQALPSAALTYWHDKGQPPAKAMLRADPVYIKVDRDSLYLLGRDALQVTLEEARSIAAQINQLYTDTSWSLEVGSAERWYVSCEENFNIHTFSVTEVFGKNINTFLPQGAGGNKWRAVLNEIQMLLHNSEVNLQREINRRLPINSVWLWGEGDLPQRPVNRANAIDHVWSNDSLCRGLAHWAKCPGHDLPSTFSEWSEQNQTARHLMVFDDMRTLVGEDFASWRCKLVELEENWFAPLQAAVESHRLQLDIESENGLTFECKPTLWNKWWPKKRPWHDWFQ